MALWYYVLTQATLGVEIYTLIINTLAEKAV
jgi:hypothetical protein